MIFHYEYKKLCDFTYNILADSSAINRFLTYWLAREWKSDHEEDSAQIWTLQWLELSR